MDAGLLSETAEGKAAAAAHVKIRGDGFIPAMDGFLWIF